MWRKPAAAVGSSVITHLTVIAVALLIAACQSRAPDASPRPNVLLLSIDSLRADRLGVYGNERDTSPTIDRLAAQGVLFENTVSPTSWTLPAHVSLLTGLDQRSHRVVDVRDEMADELATLPEIFRRAGYETVGFYSGPFLHPHFGFAQGFDDYVSCMSESEGSPKDLETLHRAHRDETNPALRAHFGGWLERRRDRPFFAFVHMWDVHYDYIPPEPYYSMFDADYDGALDGRNIIGDGFPLDAAARDVEYLKSLYDGEIRYTDAVLRSMLDGLDARGLLDNTWIVITGDHGEEFVEHGLKGHQLTLYEEVVHVPLVIWSRGLAAPAKRVAQPVALSDVAPTILEVVGLEVPAGLDGRSLVPLMQGRPFDRGPVFSELYIGRKLIVAAARRGKRKLIYDAVGDRWAEYDLARDPREQSKLGVETPELKEMLAEYVNASRLALRSAKAPAAAKARADIPAGVAEKLRKLGYLDGD